MGNFYTSVTLRGTDQPRVVTALRSLNYRAFVASTVSGLTVVCEEQSDTQDMAAWHKVAEQLSATLHCPALAILNHDDDVLLYALYAGGRIVDEYNSCPAFWDDGENPDEIAPPSGGDASALCKAFGMPGNATEVEVILRSMPDFMEDDDAEGDDGGMDDYGAFVFAVDRHVALLRALNWPEIPVFQGFAELLEQGLPPGWVSVDGEDR